MKKNYFIFLFFSILNCRLLSFGGCSAVNGDSLRRQVVETMQKASNYFRKELATNGGYVSEYSIDLKIRQGEDGIVSPTTIYIQYPGTTAVGMVFLDAYKATHDTLFLNGAISVAHALTWGQLASGGWDERIDFDPVESKKWHYRRDVEAGDTVTYKRRNYSQFDDIITQDALQVLMRVDKTLDFKNIEIHHAVLYCLDAVLKVQYPNGAWPLSYSAPPDPSKFPILKAHYPATWSRVFTGLPYNNYYTFNDSATIDVITVLMEAYKTYGDQRYLNSAKHGGDFIILAQMPEPQPGWAQQYNTNMEPAWARKFEPPSISGCEIFSILRSLLNLYVETGEQRFLEPVPKALRWIENSLLPDKRLARFYELKTNRPLYFNAPRQYSALKEPAFPALKDYTLIYEDTDLPTHYSFKVSSAPLASIKSYYNRIVEQGRDAILAERERIPDVDPDKIREIIKSLDEKGRWLEKGRKTAIISSATFVRNLSLLSAFLQSCK